MPTTNEREKRQSIIDACRSMNALGINQGTSGNISLRHDDGLLITPTSVPYETMQPEQIVFMGLDGSFDPAQRPSSEWRFHLDILRARPEVNAVVHAHPPYSTILAIMGLEIPPIHYMIACAGGDTIRCRALRDVRHAGAFGARRARARGQAGLPAGTSRHDRRRAFAVEGDVACGRGRSAGAAVSRLPADRDAARCCRKQRSRTFSAGSRDTVLPGNESGVRDELTSPQNPLRSSARR